MRKKYPPILILSTILLLAVLLCSCSGPSPAPTNAPVTASLAQATPAPTVLPSEEPANTDASPTDHPAPTEQDPEVSDEVFHCTISISCATILDNLDKCNKDKVELVPEDGWLLEPMEVVFYGGENVFNVLQRTCRQQKIHMEFSNTPIYNSAYIEGIGNLYERDVGDLSGWMYSVNGWFPNYGCGRYALKDGDVIEWVYTCDLGADVGDDFMAQADE